MLLTRMILQDIGAYRGRNELPLRAVPERPVVLYGGTNGAGKTTLFESIRLCLYGQGFSGQKITRKKYHEKIGRLFHRNLQTRKSADEASITLEFQYAKNGRTDQYRVIRTWYNNGGSIDETLTIQTAPASDIGGADGVQYAPINMDAGQLQSIIDQIIPISIADLFFFDGEKIQKMVQSSSEDLHIKYSFDTLLGLDIPDRLSEDLGLYMVRNSGDGTYEDILQDLDAQTKERDAVQRRLDQLQEKRTMLNAEINSLHKELQSKERLFFQMGGNSASERQNLAGEKEQLEKNIKYSDDMLRDIVENDLPLAIIPDQLHQVGDMLRSETKKIRASFERETLTGAFGDLLGEFKLRLGQYDAKTRGDVVSKLRGSMDAKIESLPSSCGTEFNFSLAEIRIMQGTIDALLNNRHSEICRNHDAHKHYLERLGEVSARLDAIPQQDEAGPVYSEIKSITKEIGEMEWEVQTLEKLESQQKALIVMLNSKVRKCLDMRKAGRKKRRGLEIIPGIQGALEDYSGMLRRQKIGLLESNILEGIKTCFHKKDLISSVSIDPDTYRVTLYRENSDEIPRERLSKGEQQMYAMSIVLGLARTSGRSLPFVIDTPLARLDEEHRENMVRKFYPNASHQTIIFSTNTEIIGSYFELLKPYLSHAGLIMYDAKTDGSLVFDGYFQEGRV